MMCHSASVMAYVRAVFKMPMTKQQFSELRTLGELTHRAWKHDVQVMIEGARACAYAYDQRKYGSTT